MTKTRTFLALGLVLGLVAVLSIGCGGDSPTAPSRSTTTPAAVPASSGTTANAPAPEPVATDPTPEPDASGGKGVTAKFLIPSLDLEATSTNTGHSNTGVVCATYGFQGPNLPGTPYTWHVEAKSTSVTPFPKEQIAAGIEWGRRECKRTINVQMDAFRGETCEGHNLAVVWPQDNPVTFEREPGEWEWGAATRTHEGEWSECIPRESLADLGLDTLPGAEFDGAECLRYRKVSMQQIATRLCSEETQEKSWGFVEYERCKCPCEDTGVWVLANTGRRTETFKVYVFGQFTPEFQVRLAPGETHTFYGYEGVTLTAWVGLRHIDTTRSYTCEIPTDGVEADCYSCNRPKGTLEYRCECLWLQ